MIAPPLTDGVGEKAVGGRAVHLHHVFHGIVGLVGVQNPHEMIVAAAYAASAFQFSLIDQQRPFPGFPRSYGCAATTGSSTEHQHVGFVVLNGCFLCRHNISRF